MELKRAGYANNLHRRINFHCNGTIDNSVLRKCIYENVIGPQPNYEESISNHVRQGRWQILPCNSVHLARDFRNYLIDYFRPPCNINHPAWNNRNQTQYDAMRVQLLASPFRTCAELLESLGPNITGVELFYHD